MWYGNFPAISIVVLRFLSLLHSRNRLQIDCGNFRCPLSVRSFKESKASIVLAIYDLTEVVLQHALAEYLGSNAQRTLLVNEVWPRCAGVLIATCLTTSTSQREGVNTRRSPAKQNKRRARFIARWNAAQRQSTDSSSCQQRLLTFCRCRHNRTSEVDPIYLTLKSFSHSFVLRGCFVWHCVLMEISILFFLNRIISSGNKGKRLTWSLFYSRC